MADSRCSSELLAIRAGFHRVPPILPSLAPSPSGGHIDFRWFTHLFILEVCFSVFEVHRRLWKQYYLSYFMLKR
jgi:hypothetical protein